MVNVVSGFVNTYLPGRYVYAWDGHDGECYVIVCCKRTPTWPVSLCLGWMLTAKVVSGVVNAYLPGRYPGAWAGHGGERHVIVCCKSTPT